LGSVDSKYLKNEMTTKLHILGRLPKEYFAVERKFRNILDTSPIELIKLEINQEFDRLYGADAESGDQQALAVYSPVANEAQCVVLRDSTGTITGDLRKKVRVSRHNQGIKEYFMEKYKWEERRRSRLSGKITKETHTSGQEEIYSIKESVAPSQHEVG
jgi:hypothetical protein